MKRQPGAPGIRPLVIGLVNNMPDAALEPTERQFQNLLNSASPDCEPIIHCFSLKEIERGERARAPYARPICGYGPPARRQFRWIDRDWRGAANVYLRRRDLLEQPRKCHRLDACGAYACGLVVFGGARGGLAT